MTRQEALEILDDIAAEDPLYALREFLHLLSAYRLDACAIAEPAAALVHAATLLAPERLAECSKLAKRSDLRRYWPDRLAPERRKAIARARGGVKGLDQDQG